FRTLFATIRLTAALRRSGKRRGAWHDLQRERIILVSHRTPERDATGIVHQHRDGAAFGTGPDVRQQRLHGAAPHAVPAPGADHEELLHRDLTNLYRLLECHHTGGATRLWYGAHTPSSSE